MNVFKVSEESVVKYKLVFPSRTTTEDLHQRSLLLSVSEHVNCQSLSVD